MHSRDAKRVVESLRKGLPPDGYIREFTVGRATEIEELTQRLESAKGGVLLLHANYGSGKTHLLRFIREAALASNYAVSSVTVDSRSGVRFNRMDQILGAICRNLEVPGSTEAGIRAFFDLVAEQISKSKQSAFWSSLTGKGKWDFSDELDSPAMFVAIRAWCTGNTAAKDLVEDWLSQPWAYEEAMKKKLYQTLVGSLRNHFLDSRPEWKFFNDKVLMLRPLGYQQCWAALRDLHRLAKESGLSGLILLFDEYEDVVTNLNNVAHQVAAFLNLFQFLSGKQFPGMSFYAVTPEFATKCKKLLLRKSRYDFDYSKFDHLPVFKMSPLNVSDLRKLAEKIVGVHQTAFNWRAKQQLNNSVLGKIVDKAACEPIQDRCRQTIRQVVHYLDGLVE